MKKKKIFGLAICFVALIICAPFKVQAQIESCDSVILTPSSKHFPYSGGSVLVSFDASPPSCTPLMSYYLPWITVSYENTGYGTITITVAENDTGSSRSGYVDFGPVEFMITQDLNPNADCEQNGCSVSWIGDGLCDLPCYNADCNYDDGDCGTFSGCAPGCPDSYIGDGECDTACYNDDCNYDGGDCGYDPGCAPGCPDNWIGDDICDDACNVSACNYDDCDCGGDCGDQDGDYNVDLKDYNLSVFDISGNYSDSQTGLVFEYTLVQDSKGKLTGWGNIYSSSYGMDVDLEIKGKVKDSNGIVSIKYTVKGEGVQQGSRYTSKQKSLLEINKNSLTMTGTTTLKACLNGYGCEELIYSDSYVLPDGMTGEARLSIDAEPDANGKKLEGSAELTLSNDEKYPLYAKGKYNSKNNETKFSLKGVNESTKGIKFKLNINEGTKNPTFIKGKAFGQKLIR